MATLDLPTPKMPIFSTRILRCLLAVDGWTPASLAKPLIPTSSRAANRHALILIAAVLPLACCLNSNRQNALHVAPAWAALICALVASLM